MGVYDDFKKGTGIFSTTGAPVASEPPKENPLKRAAKAVGNFLLPGKPFSSTPAPAPAPSQVAQNPEGPKIGIYEQFQKKEGIFADQGTKPVQMAAEPQKQGVYEQFKAGTGVFSTEKPSEKIFDTESQEDGFTRAKSVFAPAFSFLFKPTAERSMMKALDMRVKEALNTPAGKETVAVISEATSNIPLKTFSTLYSLGRGEFSKRYEIYDRLLSEVKDDASKSRVKEFATNVQNTVPQTAIGVLLGVGAGALTKNPAIGQTIAGAYWASLSADEQIKEKGNVESLGNIAIDTIGDQILGHYIQGIFRRPTAVIRKSIMNVLTPTAKSSFVEGSTEVAQTLLKLANDFKNSKNKTERDAIVERAKEYVRSGDILMEFGTAAVAGGVIGAGASVLGGAGSTPTNTNVVIPEGAPVREPETPEPTVPNEQDQIEQIIGKEKIDALPDLENTISELRTTVQSATDEGSRNIAISQLNEAIKEKRTIEADIDRLQKRFDSQGNFYSYAAQRTAKIFDSSGGQKPIGNTGYELGDFGRSSQERKLDVKGDRFQESQLEETLRNTVAVRRASADPETHRYDNVAHIAVMPDGEVRAVYTRINKNGKEEVVNFHTITSENYLSSLLSFGVPDGIRTRNLLVRTEPLNPLSFRDNNMVALLVGKGKEPATQAPEIAPEERVAPLEEEVKRIYAESGKDAREELKKILFELEVAEAGRREFIRDDGGTLQEVIGIQSTFPKWIPDRLRSRELFDKVMKNLSEIESIKYPTGNRPKQRELMNEILNELDSRLEVNTKSVRSAIMETYEPGTQSANEEAPRTITRGGEESGVEEEIDASTVFGFKPKEKGSASSVGALAFNPKNFEKPSSPKAGIELEKVIRRSQIAKDIEKKFLLPIRRGKFRNKALAIYKPDLKVIRYKTGGTPVVFHEVGHFINDEIPDIHRFFMGRGANHTEREALLVEYGNPPTNPGRRAKEAYAEFTRFYYTERARAQKIAPAFFAYFEKRMDEFPEIKEVMDAAAADYQRWLEMPSVAKVYSQISLEEKDERTALEKGSDTFHRLYEMGIDDIHPLKQYVDLAKKNIGEIEDSKNPYVLARLLRGWIGKSETFLEKGTFGRTFWKMENGVVAPNLKGKGLKEILKPLEEKGALAEFKIYLVAARTIELSKRGIKTGITLADAQTAYKELGNKHKEFEKSAEEIYGYQNALLEYAAESGLVSATAVKQMQALNKFYVPFNRVMDELASRGYLGKGIGNVRSGIKKIKGSDRDIVDPLETIVKNTYTIINAAERNFVSMSMVNLSKKHHELGRLFEKVPADQALAAKVKVREVIEGALPASISKLLPDELMEMSVNIFRPSFAQKGNVVSVVIAGKPQYYEVDPDLFRAIQALDVEDIAMVLKVLSYPARFLRAGATLAPEFMVRNPARDQLTAYVYSKHGFIPGVDLARGVSSLVAKDESYWLWRMGGGEHSSMVSLDREKLQQNLDQLIASKGEKALNLVKNPLRMLQILSELGEVGTRLGEMKKALKRGKDPIAASFAAREITLDFARIGSKTKALNMLVAFWNAGVQAQDKMIREFKENPVSASTKAFMAITLPSILLYFANRDDERWKEIPQWEKNLFWIVLTEKRIYRIPKPFELGILFGSLPERALEYFDTRDPETMAALARAIRDGAMPGFVPTFMLPIIENISNYSFFLDRQLVSDSKEDLPAEAQFTEYTSEFSKQIGKWIQYSPIKIDNLLRGYFAGLGSYTVKGIDGILKGTGITNPIQKPKMRFEELPVFKAFMIREPVGSSSESVNRFYEKADRSISGYNYYSGLLKKGDSIGAQDFLARNPEIMLHSYYDQIRDTIADIRKMRDVILKSRTISPEEKRRKIDEIDRLTTDLAAKALEMKLKQNE